MRANSIPLQREGRCHRLSAFSRNQFMDRVICYALDGACRRIFWSLNADTWEINTPRIYRGIKERFHSRCPRARTRASGLVCLAILIPAPPIRIVEMMMSDSLVSRRNARQRIDSREFNYASFCFAVPIFSRLGDRVLRSVPALADPREQINAKTALLSLNVFVSRPNLIIRSSRELWSVELSKEMITEFRIWARFLFFWIRGFVFRNGMMNI